jgi:hypothetical protein
MQFVRSHNRQTKTGQFYRVRAYMRHTPIKRVK